MNFSGKGRGASMPNDEQARSSVAGSAAAAAAAAETTRGVRRVHRETNAPPGTAAR